MRSSYAHRHGVIHRDIKPENILLTADGHALVADFGIARALGRGGRPSSPRPALAVGTPAYMSPEQASGERELDARTDVYSLGAVLYEMLAGEPPFTGADGAGDARAAVHRDPRRACRGAAERARERGPGASAKALAPVAGRSVRDARREFGQALATAERRDGGPTDRALRRDGGRRLLAGARSAAPPFRRSAARARPRPPDRAGRAVRLAAAATAGARRHRRRQGPGRAPVREPGRLSRRLLRRRRDRRGADQAGPGAGPRGDRPRQLQPVPRNDEAAGGDRRGSWARTTCSPARCGGRRRRAPRAGCG